MSSAKTRPVSTVGRAGSSTFEQSVSWRSVALPTEHGGWSLTAEPVLLGLLVAWSLPGLALGLAAMVAFIARTSVKLVLVDRFRRRWLPRTRLAAQIATVEVVVLIALCAYALGSGESFWLPLALAGPLIVVELWFDMRSRSRRLIPELAGSIGIGSMATAIALADGTSNRVAWGLWLVIAARSVAAIPYVRTQIMRVKSKPAPKWHSDAAQLVAVGAVLVGWAFDLVPAGAVVALVILAVINLLAVRVAPKPAVVIGIQQMVFGIAVIVITAIALS